MRAWLLTGLAALALVVVLIGAYLGGYGPLVTCGADGAAVCIAWPAAVSGAIWLAFLAFIAALVGWQIRDWRRSADPVPPNEHVAADR